MGAVNSKTNLIPGDALMSSLGELVISVDIEAITFGIATSMVYVHLRRPSSDPMWLRILVVAAWMLCVLAMADTIHAIYILTIIDYNNPKALTMVPWSVALAPTFLVAIAFVVRIAFLCRLWRFRVYSTHRPWHRKLRMALLIFTGCLSTSVLAFGILIGLRLLQFPDAHTLYRVHRNFILVFSGGILCDLILTTLLCLGLHGSRSGLRRSDSLINRLIKYSLRTCLFPTLIDIVALLSYSLSSDPLLYAPFYVQIGNLYLISLCATLNHRKTVREQFQQPLELTLDALNSTAALDLEAGSSETSTMTQSVAHRPGLHEKASSETLGGGSDSSFEMCVEDLRTVTSSSSEPDVSESDMKTNGQH